MIMCLENQKLFPFSPCLFFSPRTVNIFVHLLGRKEKNVMGCETAFNGLRVKWFCELRGERDING
jgi:hypothetical protein